MRPARPRPPDRRVPRSIQIAVPPEIADEAVRRIQAMREVVGVARMRGASLDPPGDIVQFQATNDGVRNVFGALVDLRVHEHGSIETSQPKCLITASGQRAVDLESNETVWDEMASHLRQDTNLSVNYVALMALAGSVAACGLWADMLHIVIGAMVIAPAFEPLVRMPFGLITRLPTVARSGVRSALAGYAALVAGAAIATLILGTIDAAAASDLRSREWVRYWSSFSPAGVLVSVFAAAAGAYVIAGLRSVLTTGVMIALALIPSMALVGMALAMGELPLIGDALMRWVVDAGLVVGVSALVFGVKQARLHRRPAIERSERGRG